MGEFATLWAQMDALAASKIGEALKTRGWRLTGPNTDGDWVATKGSLQEMFLRRVFDRSLKGLVAQVERSDAWDEKMAVEAAEVLGDGVLE